MNKLITLLFFCLTLFSIQSQTIINSASINKYANALEIDYCKNSINVPAGMGGQFSIGDKVLIIQMKGAELLNTEDANNGKVLEYNSAGNYEINEVKTINSLANDEVVLKYELEREYDTYGYVQIVNIPEYNDVTIQNTLTCQPWDGSTGGILIFNATGTLTLNANIDVSENGFRGALAEDQGSSDCFGLAGYVGYNCPYPLICGAKKGEGIGLRYDLNFLGRAPNANGGGGGNDHNGGGGGGGAYGYGGAGGETNGACVGLGGFGGTPLAYDNSLNKIFATGGGGAGDGGSATGGSGSTSGANAGGIVFITANEIISNNNKIITNGENVSGAAYFDGAGGGGAGGLVILDIENYNDPLEIVNIGGKGGNVEDSYSCAGLGGGGAGGITWLSQNTTPNNLSISSLGGEHGDFILAPCIGTTGNALAGDTGNYYYDFIPFLSQKEFSQLTLTAGDDTLICGNAGAPLWSNSSSSIDYSFSWQWSTGTDSNENFIFQPLFGGNYDVFAIAEFDKFGQHCEETYLVNVDMRRPNVTIQTSSFFGDTVNIGEVVFLNAVVSPTNPDYVYSWTPSERVNPNDVRNASATPYETGPFCLSITDEIDCETVECVDLYVYEPIIEAANAFSPNKDNLNNTFLPILTDDLKVVSFRIYNRWGEIIYETNENEAWDGTKNSIAQKEEVYTWYIKVVQDLSERTFEKMGNVSIVR